MKKLKLVAFAFVGMSIIMVSCSKSSSSPATTTTTSDSVIYSNWTTLNMTYEGVDSLGDSTYYQNISASKITSAVLNKGVILSYVGLPGYGSSGNDTLVLNSADLYTWTLGVYLTADFYPSNIELYANINLSGELYRYVIIPGTILTTNSVLKGLTKEQLQKVDYATITKALATGNAKTTN